MLAVGIKKRLLLFHYTGTDFVELKDVTLAEAPLTASWAGNYVCLACKAMCGALQSKVTLNRACSLEEISRMRERGGEVVPSNLHQWTCMSRLDLSCLHFHRG